MSAAIFVYVTTGSEQEAQHIGETLVQERLIACANIMPGMRSVYRWEGKVEHAQETVLILKTQADLFQPVLARVKALHSYACPCVVALPIVEGNPDYLRWIAGETA